MIELKEINKIDDKYYATVIVRDNLIKFEKIKELLNSLDYFDEYEKLDTELFLDDISNKREYACTLIISENKLVDSSCSCAWGTLCKGKKPCKHIEFLKERINGNK